MNDKLYVLLCLGVFLFFMGVSQVLEWWNHRCPTCGSRDIDHHYMYGQWCNTCLKREREQS